MQDLSESEREQILYNHIKSGDLARETKSKLKIYLHEIAHHENFSPELARRLGNRMFHKGLAINRGGLNNFFSGPIQFFESVINSLDKNKKAALTLILLHGNRLSSPVKEEYLNNYFIEAFAVSLPEIKNSLNAMRDSLVKLSIISDRQLWSLFHPSMLDSLQLLLAKDPEMLEIFLRGAESKTILREVSCLEKEHKIFVPQDLWNILSVKLFEKENNGFEQEVLIRFFLHETSDSYLRWVYEKNHEYLNGLVEQPFTQFNFGSAYKFAIRLQNLGLFNEELKRIVTKDISRIALSMCDLAFITDETIRKLINEDDVQTILLELKELGPSYFMEEFDMRLDNITETEDDIEEIAKEWVNSVEVFIKETENRSILTEKEKEEFDNILNDVSYKVRDYLMVLHSDQYEEDFENEFMDYNETKTSYTGNIFSDVDE
ncbi:hypothetical protein [Planococcus salinarum]|uniref:hypothetical protein n=1 Tax=Planococcus salinarum TaxID=622695 RepID=UPI00115F6365|nr:hypothetical protein [Planococcus salinarum]TAA67889.1 hypothetical protein D2909_14300 [Planococcus salinarum]